MTAWPGTLPQHFLKDGFKDSEPNLAVLFQTDTGPPLVRRRATAGMRQISGAMKITGAQKVILRQFYQDYCGSEIDFPDPDTGATIQIIFMEEPSFEAMGGLFQKVGLKFGVMP
jgi:hypothetical protein